MSDPYLVSFAFDVGAFDSDSITVDGFFTHLELFVNTIKNIEKNAISLSSDDTVKGLLESAFLQAIIFDESGRLSQKIFKNITSFARKLVFPLRKSLIRCL